MVADAHNDLLLELTLRAAEENPFGGRWLPKLRSGGVVLQAAPGATVLVSHAGCRGVHDDPRNLSDRQLQLLAERDGFLGVIALAWFVAGGDASLDPLVDHVDHAVGILGDRRVGIEADFIDQVLAAEREAGIEPDALTREALAAGGGRVGVRGLTGPRASRGSGLGSRRAATAAPRSTASSRRTCSESSGGRCPGEGADRGPPRRAGMCAILVGRVSLRGRRRGSELLLSDCHTGPSASAMDATPRSGRQESEDALKGSQKPKKLGKKPAQKTLKERRTEKRAAAKQTRPLDV